MVNINKIVSCVVESFLFFCVQLCQFCVVDFVSSAWSTLSVLHGRLCQFCVVDFVSSVWLTLSVLCGWLCQFCMVDFVSSAWSTLGSAWSTLGSVWSFVFSSPPQQPMTSNFEGFPSKITFLSYLNSWERASIFL